MHIYQRISQQNPTSCPSHACTQKFPFFPSTSIPAVFYHFIFFLQLPLLFPSIGHWFLNSQHTFTLSLTSWILHHFISGTTSPSKSFTFSPLSSPPRHHLLHKLPYQTASPHSSNGFIWSFLLEVTKACPSRQSDRGLQRIMSGLEPTFILANWMKAKQLTRSKANDSVISFEKCSRRFRDANTHPTWSRMWKILTIWVTTCLSKERKIIRMVLNPCF